MVAVSNALSLNLVIPNKNIPARTIVLRLRPPCDLTPCCGVSAFPRYTVNIEIHIVLALVLSHFSFQSSGRRDDNNHRS